MAVELIDVGSEERTSTYAGDRPAPKIPYLDYYDAARSAREESKKQESSRTITSTGEKFSALLQSAGNGTDRHGQMMCGTEEVLPQHSMTYREMLASKINEILEKIEAGAIKPSFPIGAAYFTLKEWEIFIEAFDKIQEEMKREAGQEVPPKDTSLAAREGIGKEEEEKVKAKTDLLLLLAEQTTCSYPSSEKEEDGQVRYNTYYTRDAIYCKKTDASGYEWEILLQDLSQYEKVMEFLGQFETGENLRFACHENFWQDFLDGTLDLDGFMEFMNTRVNDGIPNYVNVNEYGMWIDTEAAQYAKYMNEPGWFREYEIAHTLSW